ncbi:MAG: hypothetical protein IJ652_05755 [Bacteroidales bacterium]|nr:hypothetical protein [Bacteroidales bacterium]
MKPDVLKMTLLLLLSACHGAQPRNSVQPWGVRTSPRSVAEDRPYVHPPGDTLPYIIAVEYPPGHDWRISPDAALCNLAVFAGQRRILTVPQTGGLSPDPDRVRLCGTHLYQDSFSGDSTVIWRDGRRLFRYPGQEFLRGVLVDEDTVYTLGQAVSGGFTLRRNGLECFSRASGTVLGDGDLPQACALYRDQGDLCFFYTSSDGNLYLVRNTLAEQVPLPVAPCQVLDARIAGGVMTLALLLEDRLYLFRGGGIVKQMRCQDGDRICRVSILGKEGIRVTLLSPTGEMWAYFWTAGPFWRFSAPASEPFYVSAGEILLFAPDTLRGVVGPARFQPLQMPGDRLRYPACGSFKDGHTYAAVTPADDKMYPYLLQDGRRLAITIHGYLLSINVIP